MALHTVHFCKVQRTPNVQARMLQISPHNHSDWLCVPDVELQRDLRINYKTHRWEGSQWKAAAKI